MLVSTRVIPVQTMPPLVFHGCYEAEVARVLGRRSLAAMTDRPRCCLSLSPLVGHVRGFPLVQTLRMLGEQKRLSKKEQRRLTTDLIKHATSDNASQVEASRMLAIFGQLVGFAWGRDSEPPRRRSVMDGRR